MCIFLKSQAENSEGGRANEFRGNRRGNRQCRYGVNLLYRSREIRAWQDRRRMVLAGRSARLLRRHQCLYPWHRRGHGEGRADLCGSVADTSRHASGRRCRHPYPLRPGRHAPSVKPLGCCRTNLHMARLSPCCPPHLGGVRQQRLRSRGRLQADRIRVPAPPCPGGCEGGRTHPSDCDAEDRPRPRRLAIPGSAAH